MESASRRTSIPLVVLQGCILVGVLVGIDTVLYFSLRGATLSGIFQYIASGVLGSAAFDGGVGSALLGVLLHFLVAAALTALYLVVAMRWTFLWRHFIIAGIIYGLCTYVVINKVVLPLSLVPFVGPFTWSSFLNGIFAHVFLVGIPISWLVRRALTGRSSFRSNGRVRL